MKTKNKNIMTHQKRRREFIKKIVYSAPVLTSMGQLIKPVKSSAETGIPDPPVGTAARHESTNNNIANDPFKSSFDK